MAKKPPVDPSTFPKIDLQTATLEEVKAFIENEHIQRKIELTLKGDTCGNDSCDYCAISHRGKYVVGKHGRAVSCSNALMHVFVAFAQMSLGTQEATSEKSTPDDDPLNYKDTRNFMRSRGYSHCYMCGGEL